MNAHSEVSHLPVTEKETKPHEEQIQINLFFSAHSRPLCTSSHKNKHDKNQQNTSEICAHTQVPTKEKKEKKWEKKKKKTAFRAQDASQTKQQKRKKHRAWSTLSHRENQRKR